MMKFNITDSPFTVNTAVSAPTILERYCTARPIKPTAIAKMDVFL